MTGAAFIGGGASLLNSGLSAYQSNMNAQAVRDTNALNYKMWQEGLEYSKPVNQVARLKEAGLNPALMYGTGSGANVAGPAPRAEAPQREISRIDPGAVVAVQQARLLGEQARALKLENDQTAATPGARRGDSAPVRAIREGVESFRKSELGRHVGPTIEMMKKRGTSGVLQDAWNFWGGDKLKQKAKDLYNQNWFFGDPKGKGGTKK